MHSFNDNPLSNYYLLRQFKPICDSLFKFALKGRTNLLGTPEVNELYNNLPHTFCPNCALHGKSLIQSLAHILNGCVHRYPQYKERHNRIQSILLEYVRKLPGVEEIYTDHTVGLNSLPMHLRNLRPDIIAWHMNRSKCTIIEISVPYAGFNWNNDTLNKVFNNKKSKYSQLVDFIHSQNIIVEFYVVIVSSLGAVFHKSISELNRLVTCKKTCKTLIKRLSVNALWCSLNIWNHNRAPTHNISNNALDIHEIDPDSDASEEIQDHVPETQGEAPLDEDDILSDDNSAICNQDFNEDADLTPQINTDPLANDPT